MPITARRQLRLNFLLRIQSDVTVVVDGKDGTGKTTLATGLQALGFRVADPRRALRALTV